MKKKITLKEIAKKCKVSTATVSFVINNKNRKGISETTWFKIENILKKYGYKKGDFPVAEKLSQTSISLPVHEFVTKKDLKFMANIIVEGLEN